MLFHMKNFVEIQIQLFSLKICFDLYDLRYPCKGQDMAISKIISELNIAGVVRFRLHVLK